MQILWEKFSPRWISHEITLITRGDLLAKINGETQRAIEQAFIGDNYKTNL